ncbi:MAG: helicase C-terminal domain-containing protein [Candidatus Eiseniibacteriota bacterium]
MPIWNDTTIRDLLDRDGPFAARLPGFEIRVGQQELAAALFQVLESGGVLAAEAPTGIGKSLAYLVPAAIAATGGAGSPGSVVIATHTRNLQDQLVDKDVPLVAAALSDALPEPLRVVVVKGRSNYLCRRRWEALAASDAEVTLDDAGPAAAGLPDAPGDATAATAAGLPAGLRARLAQWIDATESGELSEAEEWVGPLGAWRSRLGADAAACAWGRCPRGDACFLRRLRDRARRAHLIVVNHALLFHHLLADSTFLPEADALVLDEAHRVEAVLTETTGRRVDVERLSGLRTPGGGGAADLGWLVRHLGRLDSEVDRLNLLGRVRATEGVLAAASGTLARFLRELRARLETGGVALPVRYGSEGSGVLPTERIVDDAYQDAQWQIDHGSGALADLLEALRPVAEAHPGGLEDAVTELAGVAAGWKALAGDLRLMAAPDDTQVCWVERAGDGAAFEARPLDVGEVMQERVLGRFRATLLTSATLTVAGNFDHLVDRLALDRRDPRGTHLIELESPFDFESSCRVLVDRGLPAPGDDGYADAVAAVLLDLARQVERRTLVLFTSWSLLRRVHKLVHPVCAELGRPLLAQGLDGPRRVVTRSHRRRRGSILLGTQSFWEGVDFPGEELELLVITRLPFPVPSEPLVAARGDRLRLEGREPFTELFLPEAVLRFRQGFGRLIRSRRDRGAVVCLDRRLATAGYRGVFARSLPVGPVVVPAGSLVAATRAWLEDGALTPGAGLPAVAGEPPALDGARPACSRAAIDMLDTCDIPPPDEEPVWADEEGVAAPLNVRSDPRGEDHD